MSRGRGAPAGRRDVAGVTSGDDHAEPASRDNLAIDAGALRAATAALGARRDRELDATARPRSRSTAARRRNPRCRSARADVLGGRHLVRCDARDSVSRTRRARRASRIASERGGSSSASRWRRPPTCRRPPVTRRPRPVAGAAARAAWPRRAAAGARGARRPRGALPAAARWPPRPSRDDRRAGHGGVAGRRDVARLRVLTTAEQGAVPDLQEGQGRHARSRCTIRSAKLRASCARASATSSRSAPERPATASARRRARSFRVRR